MKEVKQGLQMEEQNLYIHEESYTTGTQNGKTNIQILGRKRTVCELTTKRKKEDTRKEATCYV